MKVIQEAVVGEYHFIVSDDYVAVTLRGEEMIHLNKEEAKEVVGWLFGHLGHTTPSIRVSTIENMPIAKAYIPPTKQDVDYSIRKAVVSKDAIPYIEAMGDPFLAQSAPNSANGGKQAIHGVEVTDLGREAQKHGLPLIRK